MNKMLVPKIVLACLLLPNTIVHASAGEQAETLARAAKQDKVREVKSIGASRPLDVGTNGFAFLGGAKRSRQPVAIPEVRCDVTTESGQTERLWRYELVPTGGSSFMNVWGDHQLDFFRLLDDGTNTTWLTWVDRSSLCIAEIGENSSGRGSTPILGGVASSVYADWYINLSRYGGEFWGTRADRCEIDIVSIQRNEAGKIVVKIRSVFGETYEFIHTGGRDQWRGYHKGKEIPS